MINPLLFTVASLLVTYLYIGLRHKRFQQFAKFPQLTPSLVWGHVKKFQSISVGGNADRHPDVIFGEIARSMGSPPWVLVDFRPFNAAMLVVSNHEIAEQVARASDRFPTGGPKGSYGEMEPLVGSNSILSAGDHEWKALRKRFNPGFAPQHLTTLYPRVIARLPTFIDTLDTYARSGNEVHLVPLIIRLTFDIIGAVVMDVDLQAQSGKGELIELYHELIESYSDARTYLPWWLTLRTALRRYRLGKRIDKLLKELIVRTHADQQQETTGQKKSRSVLSLSLQQNEQLTPEIIDSTCDQLKTFLLAGHDTTSIMLGWLLYEITRAPRVLKAIRAELDKVLGPDDDPNAIFERLRAPDAPQLVQNMSYISAVIKETLRLHPPAGTARVPSQGTGFTLRTPSGEEVCVDGLMLYNCHYLIQRDPAVYGETAEDFVPERWLDSGKDGSIPAAAWRPFERGPRNCIGQEFALIEARIIIAAVARRYDFVKVGLGEAELDDNGKPVFLENGQYKTKADLYPTQQITAKPVDGMRMKIQFASEA
ncbi:putative sterigmatocystin biosynthesis P450 monooxygenase stcS [Paramyrothecium foliicola]|nr:putative sterigmatocystin biosynthesis P450 monooxygenase stcS [Paramyrothecium foliicola]